MRHEAASTTAHSLEETEREATGLCDQSVVDELLTGAMNPVNSVSSICSRLTSRGHDARLSVDYRSEP